jgi:hypothetical protein
MARKLAVAELALDKPFTPVRSMRLDGRLAALEAAA